MLIAFPSFRLLYLMDELWDPSMTILAEGFLIDGPKSYILNKREIPVNINFIGQKNNWINKKIVCIINYTS